MQGLALKKKKKKKKKIMQGVQDTIAIWINKIFNKMLLTIIWVISFLLTLRLRQTNLPNYIWIFFPAIARKMRGADYDSEDSYDYDDPFLNDGSSDDYAPTDSDDSDSEWGPSQPMNEEEKKDLKRMKKEAQKFVKKKLWRIWRFHSLSFLDGKFNEHALERHAAAVRQLSNGTNGDDLYICIATVGNTIQTVNSPMYEWVLLVTQQSCPSLVGSEPKMH